MEKEFKGTSEKIRGYRNLLQSFDEEENIWLMIAELCEYTEEKMMANRDLFVESILVRKQIPFSLTDLLQKYNDLRDVLIAWEENYEKYGIGGGGKELYDMCLKLTKQTLENTNNKN